MKLRDKVAIITGSGRGIGKEVALAYAEEGANIAITARTKPEIDEVARIIQEMGRKAFPVVADIAVQKDVKNLVASALQVFGRIDILVNNAGAVCFHPVKDLSLEDWLKIIQTNLTGTFLCCREVLPRMIEQREGVIINMLGRGAHGGPVSEGMSAYSASKGGIEVFTRVLALEVAQYNIRVNNLHPGAPIETRQTLSDPYLKNRTLLPASIIRASAVYLASDEAAQLTGQYMNVLEWNKAHGFIK